MSESGRTGLPFVPTRLPSTRACTDVMGSPDGLRTLYATVTALLLNSCPWTGP